MTNGSLMKVGPKQKNCVVQVTPLVPTLIFFLSCKKKNIKKWQYCTVQLAIQFGSTGIVASVNSGRSYNPTFATSGFAFNHPVFRVSFPHFCIKVMDSVSVLLNIFRLKCEHAAELRTFRILNCSQLESSFFLSSSMRAIAKKKKKIPTYPT